MKFNIRAKLLAAFMAMVALTLSVSAITWISQANTQNTVDDLLDVYVAISKLSRQSVIAMLEARRSEKDYLLRYKDVGFEAARTEYVTEVQAQTAAIHSNMDKIRELTTEPDTAAVANTIDQATTQYETTFLAMVALIEKRGFVDVGLEGQFREKIHAVETALAAQSLDPLTIDLLTMRRNEKDYLLRSDAKYVTQLREATARLKADLAATELNSTQKASLNTLVDEYQAAFDQYVSADAEVAASIETYRAAIHELEPLLNNILGAALAGETAARAEAQRAAQLTTLIAIGVTLGAVGLGLLLAFFLARSMSNAARQMVQAAQQIAQVDLAALAETTAAIAGGDLTQSFKFKTQLLALKSSDEMGDLARAFNQMIARLQEIGQAFSEMTSNLHDLVGQVAESANNVGAASNQLASAAAQSAQATNQIAVTVQQVAKGTAQQSTSVNKTAASVEQLSRAINGVAQGAQEQAAAVTRSAALTAQITTAIQQIAANAQAGAKGSAEQAQAARQGAKTVDETIKGMETINAKVGLSAEKVQEMGRRSDQIGTIVETIDDIASQTNLLALNAAIEAARAGEHGKGFAVVADEVRKLAEKSAAATKEIAGLIRGIQQTVGEAITAMNESAKEVGGGVKRAQESGQALADILRAAQHANKQAEEIAATAQQVGAASNDLVGAMDSVSAVVEENTAATEEMAANSGEVTQAIENIASVSEENSAAVEEVSAAAEEMSAQVEEVTASAQSLAEMAQTLQTLVAQFTLADTSQPGDKGGAKQGVAARPNTAPLAKQLAGGNGRRLEERV